MSDGEILLDARGLMKAYRGRRVVNDVNIHVRRGEVVGILGPNGAGKTTSFYMITGLIKPDAGVIFFKGIDVSQQPMYVRARMGMGYLAQDASIFRKLTVEENIYAILETLAISRKERKERLAQLLDELALTHLAKQKAMTLSGGERRRLEITRALVTNPAFILLDEPFSGVDPKAVYEVQQIIEKLKQRNMGILITDHNVEDTLCITDRAYMLFEGRILFQGTPEELASNQVVRDKYLTNSFQLRKKDFQLIGRQKGENDIETK